MEVPVPTNTNAARCASSHADAAFVFYAARSRRANVVLTAFTLVEVIIVVVIIGILAAIAIPRFSRGAEESEVRATQGDLAVLQRQIDMYAAEHNGVFPAANGDGTNAAVTEEAFLAQMLQYSDVSGTVSATKSASYALGPYLRKGMPALKVGANLGATGVKVVTGNLPAIAANPAIGWLYSVTTGQIAPNTTMDIFSDDSGGQINLNSNMSITPGDGLGEGGTEIELPAEGGPG